MHERDIELPQSDDQVDELLGGIAGSIMDMVDEKNPNHSGVVEAKAAKTEDQEETQEASQTQSDAKADEGQPNEEKFIIKWQGQDREVTQKELLELAQKGFDYTQKTQQLAQERDSLAPYIGIVNKIKSDPNFANQLAAMLVGQTQPQQQKEAPKFEDPIEQLKWEIKNEVISETQKILNQNLTPMQRQAALDRVKMSVQADPDYQQVQSAIIDMLKSQPPALQKTLFMQLDQDPEAYLQTYNHIKQQIRSKSQEPATKPEPIRRDTKAPIVESGGVSQPDIIESKERREKISKQKAQALRSGDNRELANWLQASGALDHLY